MKPMTYNITVQELIQLLNTELKPTDRLELEIKKVEPQESKQAPQMPLQMQRLLAKVNQFGGLSLEGSEHFLKHSKAFRDEFSFKADEK